MSKKTKSSVSAYYPQWVCRECVDKTGFKQTERIVACFHTGICGVCLEEKTVTEPRDYHYPKFKLSKQTQKLIKDGELERRENAFEAKVLLQNCLDEIRTKYGLELEVLVDIAYDEEYVYGPMVLEHNVFFKKSVSAKESK